MPPVDRSVLAFGPPGFHRIAYREWGDADNPRVLVCLHGLTRNSHDFDRLAQALAQEWRVICPDLPGRGSSDWLAEAGLYDFPVYLSAMTTLLARLDVERVDWLGTSLGGLVGLVLAAQDKTPIKRLVLNDIGPLVPRQGLARLRQAAALSAPTFADLSQAEAWFRGAMMTFGRLDEAAWREVARHGVRPLADGRLALHYDPAILSNAVAGGGDEVSLWPLWDRLTCPVLALRGAQSDFLGADIADEMQSRGPGCDVIVVEDTGHAPMLMAPAEIRAVEEWLRR